MSEITLLMWIDWGHTQGLYKTCTNSQQGMIFWIFHAAMFKILTFLFNHLLWFSNQNRWGNTCRGPDCSLTSSVCCFRLSIHLPGVQSQHLSLLLLRLVVSGWFKFSKAFRFTLANLKHIKPHSVWGQLSTWDGMWSVGSIYTKSKMLFSVLSNSPQPFISDMLSKLQSMSSIFRSIQYCYQASTAHQAPPSSSLSRGSLARRIPLYKLRTGTYLAKWDDKK